MFLLIGKKSLVQWRNPLQRHIKELLLQVFLAGIAVDFMLLEL